MSILSRLQLRRFRNYSSLRLSLCPGINLFVGGNGQGKTNILEAICYLALLRSFRSRKITPLRQWDSRLFYLAATLVPVAGGGGSRQELAISYGERRCLSIDGKRQDKASEFINQFLCVPMVPEDIDLVKGVAAGRRRFLDIALSQHDPVYLPHLQRYTAAVRNRNMMLRQAGKYPNSALTAYDHLVVRYGTQIDLRRWQFVQGLNAALAVIAPQLLGAAGQSLSARFLSSLCSGEGSEITEEVVSRKFRESLEKNLARDREEGRTSTGPHRDDLLFCKNHRPLLAYGSEGECRIACLALRLAAMELLRDGAGSKREVVLLVDDVFGELDSRRRQAFCELLGRADQVFVADTDVPTELRGRIARAYAVEAGSVCA